MKATDVEKDLQRLTTSAKAKASSWFFKSGEGEYGYGDKFIGVTVPEQRSVAKKYFKDIDLGEVEKLLHSEIHEYRLTALIILTYKFAKESEEGKKKIYDIYLKNLKYVNNWDLVDSSADKIVGAYIQDRDRSILYKLAKSDDLWENRVAMISTFHFIKNGEHEDTFKIAEILLHHKHDLIHKAVGWMLRELGKKQGEARLRSFLDKHYLEMPRTMLRYAIEKFEESVRLKYLSKK